MSAPLSSPEPADADNRSEPVEADELPDSEDTDSATEALDAEDVAAGRRPYWRAWVYGIVVMVVLFCGAAREPWARGLALLLMGGAMVMAPPRMKLRPLPSMILVILALVPGAGLLPSSWFGGMEPWRQTLGQEWGIDMPSTLSPEWKLTLEAWLVTVVGVAWFWCCLAQNFSDGGRRLLLRLLCLGVLPLAVLSLLDKAGWVDAFWWPRGHADATTQDATGFGPFANQNHSSSLFAWMSVLCAAAMVDAFKQKSRSWMIFGAGVLLLLGCILVNTSRAGLLLFFTGMTLWLATTAMRRGVMRKLVVTMAIIAAVVSIAVASGGRLGERLTDKSISTSLSSDLRLWLAGHVLRATADAPWSGRGLGVFDHVFPQVCDGFYPDARTMHPESDLLWALFEGGLMLVLPCLILVGWLFQTSGPWMSSRRRKRSQDSRAGRRVRRAFGIAAGLALMHGIFDVPLHNFGYFMVFALVTAQAVRGRYLTARIQPALSLAFRGAGVAVAAWGALWMAFAFGQTEVSTASGATLLHDRAVAQAAQGQRAEAMRLINRAIELTPLQYRWYFLRAQLHLVMRHGSAVALEDFGRVRALEPRYGPVCFEEGRYWLFFDPPMALIPWKEGMRRYPREFSNAMPRFQEIVLEAKAFPEISQQLWRVADRPSLQLVFLAHVNEPRDFWLKCQREFLAQHPALVGLNEPQKRFFFRRWQQTGDLKEMVAYLQDHPTLQPYGWQALAKDLAASGKFEEAFKLAARYLPAPARSATLTSADIPRLERAHVLNPIDPLPGVELYYAQRSAGDLKSARKTLERVMGLPGSPVFLPREMASVLAESGDMRGAWELMQGLFDNETVEVGVLDDAPPDAMSTEGFAPPTAPPARDADSAMRDAY
ncbi:O-antigen ligase family protein [Brevifollis gellanilyticus]|uniref:O-antigen ligase-related domain-containing protein n=1 Tax=Brevifollis gellanilyticus TaxID=748831 RepID=A0A512M9U3_9BACT|nr:O-antigen ligase family protein [Brevifollis gellanilyticus]GEP43510.1 hypothetical protein BGE01nite_28010 [Brevifollis gellanilyticus]